MYFVNSRDFNSVYLQMKNLEYTHRGVIRSFSTVYLKCMEIKIV